MSREILVILLHGKWAKKKERSQPNAILTENVLSAK